jgi:hypothetical protein
MNTEKVVSPSWKDAEEFLGLIGAEDSTLERFRDIKSRSQEEGKGEMASKYPVFYIEDFSEKLSDYELHIEPARYDIGDPKSRKRNNLVKKGQRPDWKLPEEYEINH